MKKVIAYIVSWALYGLGDMVSRLMQWFDWAWIYPVYNKLMLASSDVQDWAGNAGPWRKSDGI